jgi:S-adenosylmethionine hydrolase
MPVSPRLITLTTDFGASDHFVAAMKGMIATIAPRARVIDVTHEITPYEIMEGAFVIAETWRNFPQGTVHVIVVDPGVGSARRPILAEAGGHYFVAPDNGSLSMIYYAASKLTVREITNPKLMAKEVSRTFHGRDIFAPTAAHLTLGVPAKTFGKPIHDCVTIDGIQPQRSGDKSWRGTILKADRFGNLITNFHIDDFGVITTRAFELRIGTETIRRLALTFSEAAIGELVAVVGSAGYLEVAANQTSAAKILGCGPRAPVELEF